MKHLLLFSFVLLSACGSESPATKEEAPQQREEPIIVSSEENVAPKTTTKEAFADGPYREHYPDGSLKIEGVINGGKRDGTWTSYHSNGIKASENNYHLGELHGKTTTWSNKGQVRYIGYYSRGARSGKWIFFDENGEQIQEETF